VGGAEQPEVADLDEVWREDVLQEATDELLGAECAVAELVSGRLFVRESDLAIMQLAKTVVTEGDAKDVRGEILESLCATANRLGVDHPVFAPDARLDLSKESGLFQGVTQLGAEDSGECYHRNQKVFAGGAPVAVVSEAAAGDEVMDVGMIEELAGPGMQYSDHAQAGADEPWI